MVTLSLMFLPGGMTRTPGALRERKADALALTAAADVAVTAAVAAAEGLVAPSLPPTLLLVPLLAVLPLLLLPLSLAAGVRLTPLAVLTPWLRVHVNVVKLMLVRLLTVMLGIKAVVLEQPPNTTLDEARACCAPCEDASGSEVAKLTTCGMHQLAA
jgi:hypothetical protein